MKTQNYKIVPGMAWRVIGEKAYVFDPTTSQLHELSETAAVAWLELDKHKSSTAIAKRFCEDFEVSPEQALNDVNTLLMDLKTKGLIE